MTLLRYFQQCTDPLLPKPDGPLSTVVSSSSITTANKQVKRVLDLSDRAGGKDPTPKRGKYKHYTGTEKAQIGKRAVEHGVVATIRYFSKVFPDHLLKESSVRTWKKYLQEIARRRREGKNLLVKELPEKKTGRPLMLREGLDKQVQAYLVSLRENGAVINIATCIAMACAQGGVKSYDSNLLECNGGHISLTKNWTKYLMERMGFVKRRASTKAKVSVSDFDQLKSQFVFDVKAIVEIGRDSRGACH